MKSLIFDWKFLLLIFLVTIIQFSLLGIALQNGFTSDDWWLLFDYKTIGYGLGFLEKYLLTLRVVGLYHTYQIIYVGILEGFFKGDYQSYQITGIILKALATVSLYPLLLAFFKRKLLAFLATLLYGISYSSAGAMLFVCTGSDYLAIFFMNIFMLCYYTSFVSKRKLLLYISTILLFLSFISSPIRMFPLLAIVFLIEFFIWIKSKKILGFFRFCLRLALLFFPFFVILYFFPGSTGGQLNGLSSLLSSLSFGNYQLLLTPFAGIGYTFLTNDYWPIFGQISYDNLGNFFQFLLHGPIVIYSILTILFGLLITKKPFRLIIGIILINFLFEVGSYFLVTNIRGLTGPNVKGFYPVSTYAIFLGFFITSIAFSSGWVWLKTKKSKLLLSLFLGPVFSSIFLLGIWFIKGDVLTFKEGIHWYMVIAPIGSSLFLATILVLIFDKIKSINYLYIRYFLIILLASIIIPIYLISSREIKTTFSELIATGSRAQDHEQMKNVLLGYIKSPLEEKPTLFYFEPKNEKFYPISLLVGFEETMHFRNWELVNGCDGLIYDKNILAKAATIQNGTRGFYTASLCVKNSFEASRPAIFFDLDSFYAFRLEDKKIIDIKEEVINSLEFK